MADEEVDWGMDESVDVWRQGETVAVGDDEDAISLDGMEGEGDAAKPSTGKTTTSPRRASSSRPPPTGPRKPIKRPEAPTAPSGTPPTGPKRTTEDRTRERERPREREREAPASRADSRVSSGTTPAGAPAAPASANSANAQQAKERNVVDTPEEASTSKSNGKIPDQSKPRTSVTAETSNPKASEKSQTQPGAMRGQAPPTIRAANRTSTQNSDSSTASKTVQEPLPEGWTEVVSRSSGGVFYHNKGTGETSWTRPKITPPKEEAVNSRPSTPPPAAAAAAAAGGTAPTKTTVINGDKAATPAKPAESPSIKKPDFTVPVAPAAPSAPAATAAAKAERQPPTGPGGGRSAADSASKPGEKKADTKSDPVQSAYANRRTAMAGKDSRGPDDRGVKRSPSPRRDDPKRFRGEDSRGPSHGNDRDVRAAPPAGPRSYANDPRPTRSPPRSRPEDDRPRAPRDGPRDAPRHDGRNFPSRPPIAPEPPRNPSYARGPNHAPLNASRWGSRPTSDSPLPSGPDSRDRGEPARSAVPISRDAPRGVSATAPPPRSTASAADDASAQRARLREEARKAEETLRKIKEEDERLEKIEQEKKRRDEADRRRKEDDRGRQDDLGRRRETDRRGEDDRRFMDMARDRMERDRRPPSPKRLQYEDRSYRPAGSPPPRGPPPASRLDGPGPPPMIRDARRTRPDSPTRIARRTSPPSVPPIARDRGRPEMDRPPVRLSGLGGPLSPPRRNGDSYHPSAMSERDRPRERERPGYAGGPPPSGSLADRIGRPRGPEPFGEPMRQRPRSPPPPQSMRGGDSFRPNDGPPTGPGYRSLAERMSRDVGGRDPRDSRGLRDPRDDLARRM